MHNGIDKYWVRIDSWIMFGWDKFIFYIFPWNDFVLFLFKAFFILAGCGIKYLYERRLASHLQNELNGFLYDYIALEGNEIETINFINEMSRMDSKGKSSDM